MKQTQKNGKIAGKTHVQSGQKLSKNPNKMTEKCV